MQGLTSVSGLISGIQTDSIIQQMTQFDQAAVQQYQTEQDTLRTQLSAYQEANTRLAAVDAAAGALANSSLFDSRTATSSNTAVATATAGAGAAPGNYVVTVQSLARAHQVLTQSYSDISTTTIGTGTFTITSAGQNTQIQVDSSNNTLGGLRDAINRANTNVQASIVQDGDSSYRLMISSKQTGTANALTINSTLSGGTGPTFTDLQTAKDAKVTLGSGANAITIVRSTNAVQDLIPGVTLNLVSEAPDAPVTVSVSQDKTKVQDAVQKLVDQYNNAVDYFNQQFNFNPDTKKGGTLLGDFTLKDVQGQLADVFTRGVPGIASGTHTLADVGVSVGADGKLALDAAALQSKLDSDPAGVTQVFALTAQSTNAGVQLAAAGSKTVIDGSAYDVAITQAARQARVTAGVAQSGALGADETLTINGVSVALTAGMTQAQVLAAINARTKDTGVKALATGADGTGSGNYLTFLTTGYGSAAALSVVSGRSGGAGDSSGVGNVAATAAHPGGESGSGTGAAGQDVAGTINGEAATGTGQVLTGNAGNAKTDGLRLTITAAAPGALGSIRLFNGIANAASQTLARATSTDSGPIQSQEDSINQRIQDLQKVIDDQQAASKSREDALRTEFNNMEAALAQYQNQSAYLSAQLSKL